MNPTIIIADDHPISGKGMESVLKKMGFNILGNCQNGIQALNEILVKKPQYVLLDVKMPGLSGLDIAERLYNNKIGCKVIIYTMFTEVSLFERAKELKVDGYLLKEFALDDLEDCINAIKSGKRWFHPDLKDKLKASYNNFSPDLYCTLTRKEKLIVAEIAERKSTKEIAKEHFLSERTIESHRRNIRHKLKLPSKKNALLMWAIENKGFFGLVD